VKTKEAAMRSVVTGGVLGVLILVVLAGGDVFAQHGNCVPDPTDSGYRVYYHNAGLYPECPECIQDLDMDMPEYQKFIDDFPVSDISGPPVISDKFPSCPSGEQPHGKVVWDYFEYAYYADENVADTSRAGNSKWADVIHRIAREYDRGTVVNVCWSDGWNEKTDPGTFEAAYDSELVIVGPWLVFVNGRDDVGDKVLIVSQVNALGDFDLEPTLDYTNLAVVCLPTCWPEEGSPENLIVKPGDEWYCQYHCCRTERGSFSTPLVSGAVQRVADAVCPRELPQGEFVDAVLDYVISACDRNVPPLDYEHRTGAGYKSFGPW
jgi:hypothetical protein